MKLLNIRHKVAVLTGVLAGTYGLATATYMVADNRALGDAMWWAFITFTTVGYGDQYPDSTIGRIAGAILVTSSVFMVIPTITAVIVSKIIGNKNEFTHEEQEELKTLVREIHQNVTKASQ